MKVMYNGKQFTQGGTYQYNEKRKPIVNAGHANAAINAIHNNPNMTKEEKIAAARAILNETQKPAANANKSKVCVIANRLIKQGLTRSGAFRKAWQTVKAETIETKVAGVSYGNRQTALEHLKKYDSELISVNLKRETANEHDNNAIAVIATVTGKGSYTMGYLPKTLSATIAPLIDYGKAVTAKFQQVIGKYHNYHNYGLSVSLSI
jgi:hypothetical protein